jgi:uncharacterized protein YcgL (UPF0745 family)
MVCFIYKSLKKSDTYLFVSQKGDFRAVPDALKQMLGKLEYVMEVDLDTREKLAQADVGQVRWRLQQQGFYLQLPPAAVFHDV